MYTSKASIQNLPVQIQLGPVAHEQMWAVHRARQKKGLKRETLKYFNALS